MRHTQKNRSRRAGYKATTHNKRKKSHAGGITITKTRERPGMKKRDMRTHAAAVTGHTLVINR